MFKHREKRHGDNPAAKQLIARFKAILKNKRLTMAQLDAKAPLVLEGEAEDGYEQVRSLDAIASERRRTCSPTISRCTRTSTASGSPLLEAFENRCAALVDWTACPLYVSPSAIASPPAPATSQSSVSTTADACPHLGRDLRDILRYFAIFRDILRSFSDIYDIAKKSIRV